MAIQIGDKIPSFKATKQDGTAFDSHEIHEKPVVIYFYPKDFTPGCTTQACSFRDAYQDFQDLGAEVIGVSGDSASSHQSFQQKYKLPFILLSDADRKLKMNKLNPKYVLRNYMAQLAIEAAEKEDYSFINELHELLKHPYDEQPENEKWFAKRPDWARNKVGCSMLSCSS